MYNADGSVTLDKNSGTGNSYGAGLSTAHYNAGNPPANFNGVAFGGGGYFEAELLFTPVLTGTLPTWPAFWSLTAEQSALGTGAFSAQWPGQAAGYLHSVEVDFFEYDAFLTTKYGIAMHDDYGFNGSQSTVNPSTGSPVSVGAANFSQFHKFGYLWIPATASTNGTGQYFFDGVQVGNTITWSQNNDAGLSPPPSGTQIGSVLDNRHLMLIIGNSSVDPVAMQMVVKSVSVWQVSDANNLHQ